IDALMEISFPFCSEMENVLENVVALVKEHQDGIPLTKMSQFYNQTYHTNLAVRDLNFNSMLSMVSSLEDLVVEGNVVFHKEHCRQSQDAAGAGFRPPASQTKASTKPQTKKKEKAKILQNVVGLIKEHPEGILLKNVAIFYSQTYKKNLSLSSLGFTNMSCLVESLKGDLVVKGEMVFHKIYLSEGQPVAGTLTKIKEDSRPTIPQPPQSLKESGNSNLTPQAPASQWDNSVAPLQPLMSFLGSSLIGSAPNHYIPGIPPVAASQPAKLLTQEELYQRVMEVIKTYQLATPTMEQLQTCYSRKFDEPFPLRQYMSLYDNWEAKKLPAQAESAANSKTNAWQTTEDDYPALGASKAVPTEKKSKVKEANEKEASAFVFRERHYAQQREVHRSNMRAVEAMEEEDEDPKLRRRNRAMDPEWINSVTESVIREIASDGELVTKEKVK
ncbi:hypothetical protein GOODEAATRI_025470, partial [Goodea atripinnis]